MSPATTPPSTCKPTSTATPPGSRDLPGRPEDMRKEAGSRPGPLGVRPGRWVSSGPREDAHETLGACVGCLLPGGADEGVFVCLGSGRAMLTQVVRVGS